MLVICHERSHKVLHTDRIIGRNDNFGVRDSCINLIWWNCVKPADPLGFVHIVMPVVNLSIFGESNRIFLHSIPHPLVKHLATGEIRRATHRPDEAEHEDGLDLGRKLLDLLFVDLLDLSLVVLGKIAVKQTHARLSNVVINGENHFF